MLIHKAVGQGQDKGPGKAVEVRLYGEAEAIRVLYQTARVEPSPPKPPRPKRRRGSWVARLWDALSPSLPDPAGAEA
jgi:hypothetical protein